MDLNASNATANVGEASYTQVIHEEPKTRDDTTTSGEHGEASATLRLRLTKNPKTKLTRRVSWTTETIDNEFLNKKKSKCCCIYQKPRTFDESSSEDENIDKNCLHCKGHRKTDYNSLKDEKKVSELTQSELHDDDNIVEEGSTRKHEHHHRHHHNHGNDGIGDD